MRDITDIYSTFIYKRTYSRWDWEKGRREQWEETVERYFNFFRPRVPEQLLKSFEKAKQYVLDKKVMPSMRALWSAGEALEKDNIAGYNCAYLIIDRPKAFSEMMYILMNGTGAGFSVERQYIVKLPEIPAKLQHDDAKIVVDDSKRGWAEAYEEYINGLYNGHIHPVDFSEVRPEGAILKTFGGRASGPEPLKRLVEFTERVFQNAKGRKLNSLECHDIACYVASIVVVGGVRRSACISLSNLSDLRMRDAKQGQFWETSDWRMLSNNSTAYTERPEMSIFMDEWQRLMDSQTGERGIFNREAANIIAEKTGRRKPHEDFGCNPSLRAGTKLLTKDGIFPIEELENTEFKVNTLNNEWSDAKCWLSGKNKQLMEIKLTGGLSYFCTKEHKWPVLIDGKINKKETTELKSDDLLFTISDNFKMDHYGDVGNYDDGFLIGWNLGDGWITDRSDVDYRQFGFCYNKTEAEIGQKLQTLLKKYCSANFSERKSTFEYNTVSLKLKQLFDVHQVSHKSAGLPKTIWAEDSDSFRRGLIDGLFSADGSVSDTGDISFYTSHELMANDVSDLLGFYGIRNSVLKIERDHCSFPNGKEYDRSYVLYHVRIRNKVNKKRFSEIFQLTSLKKQALLENNKLIETKPENVIKIVDVIKTDIFEDVWDVSVNDETHTFQLAHCFTGNCSEIILRPDEFCVKGDTPLITKNSIDEIENLIDQTVEVWNGEEWTDVVVRKISENQRMLRVTLTDGSYLDCTEDHKFSVKDRFKKEWREVKAKDLMTFSKYSVQCEPSNIVFDDGIDYDKDPYTLGFAIGDGYLVKSKKGVYDQVNIDLYGEKDWKCPVKGFRHKEYLPKGYNVPKIRVNCKEEVDVDLFINLRQNLDGLRELSLWNRKSILSFIAGWLDADGANQSNGVRLYISDEQRSKNLQLLLTKMGIYSSLSLFQKAGTQTNLGLRKKDLYYLTITDCGDIPCCRLNTSNGSKPKFKGKYQNIKSVDMIDGLYDSYCFTEPKRHKSVFGNILTHQCNLSEVVVRYNDTLNDLTEKVKYATILGILQSTLTDFKYLDETWKNNCDEERLLGVSLTGVMDHPVLSNEKKAERLEDWLSTMKGTAIRIAKKWSKHMDINMPAAITCTKPSGCFQPLQSLRTTKGIKSLDDIFKENGVNLEEKQDEYREWYDVKKEMFVYDENNDKQKITRLFVNGAEETLKLTLDDGNVIECTPNHKFKLKTGQWKEARDLTESDDLLNF